MSDLIFTEKVSGATPPVGKRTLYYKLDGKLYTKDSSGSETSFPTLTDIAAAAYATVNGVQTLTNKTLTSPVINSPTGIVKGDVGLGNADNTSDVNKPVSTAQVAADTAALNAAKSYADSLVVGLLDDRGNYNASTNVFPSSGGSGAAGAILKGDLWSISIGGTLGGVAVTTGDVLRALVDAPGATSTNWVITENNIGYVAENSANKNATGGYAGLTGFSLNLRNAANTITSFFSTAATVARTWTMPDKSGTVAMTSDITGTNSGTNTGDQDLSAVVTLAGTQTLTNKTLTTPAITAPTGIVKSDVGLANVDNTSDLAKPLSTADNAALALKANLAGPTFTGTVSGITKAMVSLGNVDNTSDATQNSSVATLTNKSLATEVLPIVVNNLPSSQPTLNLNFTNSQSVDPRITFTRASTATRINAKGLIESVLSGVPRINFDPVTLACKGLLIEEQRTNLLLYSEQFDNAAWVKAAVSVSANGSLSPDGAITMDKLVENTANSEHGIYQVRTGSNETVTYSIYAKAAERTRLKVNMANFATASCGAVFDVSAGTVVSTDAANADYTAPFASIVNVGGGIYRCIFTVTKGSVNTTNNTVIALVNGTTTVYAGDGALGLFVWGVQLEAGAFATSYTPSTVTFTGRTSTATFIGSNGLIQTALSGVARLDYNPSNLTVAPKLLLESAATNLLLYSEQFDNAAWGKNNITVTANAATAPDGTTTADKLAENANVGSKQLFMGGVASIVSGTVYTASLYLKASERSFAYVEAGATPFGSGSFYVNLSTGVVQNATGVYAGVTAVSSGSGWWRLMVTATAIATTTSPPFDLRISSTGADTGSYTGNGTSGLFIWGAQLEAGFATSYVPTVAAQVTRAADTSTSAQTTRAGDVATMTGANFSSWYRQDEGTFAVGFDHLAPSSPGFDRVFEVNDNTFNNNITLVKNNGSGSFFTSVAVANVSQASLLTTAMTAGVAVKTALAYKLNDFAQSHNGAAATTDLSGTVPTVTQFGFCAVSGVSPHNGHIQSLAYFNKRLTNLELQALSTQ